MSSQEYYNLRQEAIKAFKLQGKPYSTWSPSDKQAVDRYIQRNISRAGDSTYSKLYNNSSLNAEQRDALARQMLGKEGLDSEAAKDWANQQANSWMGSFNEGGGAGAAGEDPFSWNWGAGDEAEAPESKPNPEFSPETEYSGNEEDDSEDEESEEDESPDMPKGEEKSETKPEGEQTSPEGEPGLGRPVPEGGAADAGANAASRAATGLGDAAAAEGGAAATAAAEAAGAEAAVVTTEAGMAALFGSGLGEVLLIILGIILVVFALSLILPPAAPASPKTDLYTPPSNVLEYCKTDYGFYSTAEAKKLFGSSQKEVSSQLVSIDFPVTTGKINVHKKAAPCFEAVGKEIVASQINYKMVSGGTFNWRQMRGGASLSMHSFGIALDINVGQNPWLGGTPPNCKTDIPVQVRDIFKKYGFSWGGAWNSACDAMHFEWHGLKP